MCWCLWIVLIDVDDGGVCDDGMCDGCDVCGDVECEFDCGVVCGGE